MNIEGIRPLHVFLSYSHKDERSVEQLLAHLSLLKREGIIRTWHDRRIEPGTAWNDKIERELKRADLILILLSADFLDSDYCYDIEVTTALEMHDRREARLIPLVLRPCDWESAPFGHLQALPCDAKAITSWANLDEAWLDVARGLRRVIKEMVAGETGEIRELTPSFSGRSLEGNHETRTDVEPATPIPHLIINGEAIREPLSVRRSTGRAGVVVRTVCGTGIIHQVIQSPAAPISRGPYEIEVASENVTEETRAILGRCSRVAPIGHLRIWVDDLHEDEWIGDGKRTTFILSRSLPYGSTAVPFALRTPRAFVGAYPDQSCKTELEVGVDRRSISRRQTVS